MQFGSRFISLERPRVMGVLNVTPDSFSDGGQHFGSGRARLDLCLKRAEQMLCEGATFVDVGGESTRPGAEPVSVEEESARVLPVVEAIAARMDIAISVDTSTPDIMTAAAALGANLINDVRALSREGALVAVRKSKLPACLMHMQGEPSSMQLKPQYRNVANEVRDFLLERISACEQAGISPDQLIVDPGIGFGKTDEDNIALLKMGHNLVGGRWPLLVGVSRKSMIGRLLNREVGQRLAGSLAFAYAALNAGARILRVHDVAETVDIVEVFTLMNEFERKND